MFKVSEKNQKFLICCIYETESKKDEGTEKETRRQKREQKKKVLEKTQELSQKFGTLRSTGKIERLVSTVIILNIGTDRSEQTVQTQIRLLLMEQSDQGLLCLLFCWHLLNTILHCKIQLFQL